MYNYDYIEIDGELYRILNSFECKGMEIGVLLEVEEGDRYADE